MDIEKLIEQLRDKGCEDCPYRDTCRDDDTAECVIRLNAATDLSTLQAENEKLRAELEQVKEKNAGLALALLTECAPNPDCLGSDEWRVIKAELEQAKRERDAAIDCIYQIEDDLNRGNDNDWAREHIAEWESQKED